MIGIVKYNAGNIASVANALERLGYDYIVSGEASVLQKADKVILPGVGAAAMAMNYLVEHKLDQLIVNLAQPVLGICLGLQLMCRHSEEGDTKCLGIFDTIVRKLPAYGLVPHMGWNNIVQRKSALLAHLEDTDDVYFVHSYAADFCSDTIAVCDYLKPFSAALQKDNFYATQFHPEKSSVVGELILKNFLNL